MNFTLADKVFFDQFADDVLHGKPPLIFKTGIGELADLGIGADQVVLIGGQPGAGKTSFTLQLVTDALRNHPDLKVLYACCEMSPFALLTKQLARFSGISATKIRQRNYDAEMRRRIDHALRELRGIASRLVFLNQPYSIKNLIESADDQNAGIVVIDYVQRFEPRGDHKDKRSGMNEIMTDCRTIAGHGLAVVIISAVGRQKGKSGSSSYENLNMASFRESSELEFGCDQAFILSPGAVDDMVYLTHLKNRHGELRSLTLEFNKPTQLFKALPDEKNNTPQKSTPKSSKKKEVSV